MMKCVQYNNYSIIRVIIRVSPYAASLSHCKETCIIVGALVSARVASAACALLALTWGSNKTD